MRVKIIAIALFIMHTASGMGNETCMFNQKNTKFVGVGVLFIQNDKVLLVHRKSTGRNDNLYGLVGGLVEAHETVQDAAVREIKEEVGVEVRKEDLHFAHCVSQLQNDTEVVGIYFLVTQWIGNLINNEPAKHDSIEWFPLDNLPDDIIERNKQVIEAVQKNVLYSEYGWKK